MRPIFPELLLAQSISIDPAFQSISRQRAQTQASLTDKPFDFGVFTKFLPWQLLQIKQVLLAHLAPKFNVSSLDESTMQQKNLCLFFPVTYYVAFC